jgi:prepilin-type N-terminal cleavage/methylation domain-containing protein
MDSYSGPTHRNKKPAGAARRAERTADRGFTLIEGLMAAMISAVLAMVLLTMLRMNNDSVKYGAVNAKIRSQYEIAIQEIGTYTRMAHAVLNEGSGEAYPPVAALTADTTSKIMMYDEDANGAGIQTRGFWVDNGQLKEWKNDGNGWRLFVVGKWPTVSVSDATPFQLSASRKTVTVSMRVSGTFGGVTAIAPARGEVFICRNSPGG